MKVPKGWEYSPLSEIIASLEPGVSLNADSQPAANGGLGVLKVSAVGDGRFFPLENKALPPDVAVTCRVTPHAGDVLISRANTYELVGASGLVSEAHPNLILPDKLWRVVLRDRGSDTTRWLIQVLNTPRMRSDLRARATGTSGSMKNISQEAFLGISVLRPPLGEQRRIAEILGAWDEAIEKVQALIQAKQKLKRGLMQQLLTPTRRFPQFTAKWRKCHIGDIADEVNATNGDGGDAPVLSCTKHHGLVLSEEYFGRRVHAEDTSGYKLVKRGQFAYATNHIEEGSIGLLADLPTGLVSPMYTVFQVHDDEVVPSLLYRILKTERYRRQFEARTNGSVNRRGGLRWTEFAKIPLSLPTPEEQRHIEACFAALDAETQQLSNMNDTLTTQKRGLMQKLLTGQVRLRMEEHPDD